jgi:hypothetical protein
MVPEGAAARSVTLPPGDLTTSTCYPSSIPRCRSKSFLKVTGPFAVTVNVNVNVNVNVVKMILLQRS